MSSALLDAQCVAHGVGTVNTLVTTLLQAILTAHCSISTPESWPKDYADTVLKEGLGRYDFVVVGAGTAGSVVASRLSENPKWKILVIEAGGEPPLEEEVPRLMYTLQHTNYTWNYWTQPNNKACKAMQNGACYWPRGKLIGGSGGVNAMLYIRGNPEDYNNWLAAGNINWGWHNVLPYFKKSVQPVGNQTHPLGYTVLSEFERHDLEAHKMVLAGAAELGLPHVKDFTEGRWLGYANVPGTVKDGHRMSTGKTYLGRASGRENLHVITNAQATKINFDKKGSVVKSLNFKIRGRKEMTLEIDKELVLSAGSIDTPKLLLLSGVGPKEHMETLNISMLHELPIGENLQDHLLCIVFLKIEEHTAVEIDEKYILDQIYNYTIHSRGAFASHGLFRLTAFLNSVENATSPFPDIANHHTFFRRGDLNGLNIFLKSVGFRVDFVEYLLLALRTAHLLTIMPVLSHPKSVGFVRLSSSEYRDAPVIFPNYLAYEEDVAALLRGIQHVAKMEQTAAFRSRNSQILHIPIEECDRFIFRSEPYWRCYMEYFSTTVYHPVGTVKMGPQGDRSACVDTNLRLNGVQNLRVVDASIMSSIPSCNTNAPTIMIAERGADFIKEDWLLK